MVLKKVKVRNLFLYTTLSATFIVDIFELLRNVSYTFVACLPANAVTRPNHLSFHILGKEGSR